MTLMFFLSGLFVPSSLAAKGSWNFLSDRLLRIGLPMALAILLSWRRSPITAAYRTTAADPSQAPISKHWLALPFWPCGPAVGSWPSCWHSTCSRAGGHRFLPRWDRHLARLVAAPTSNHVRFFAASGGDFGGCATFR
jgi:hypothetical protein